MPLQNSLNNWTERKPPEDTAKELLEANKRIEELQKKLPEFIKQEQNYKDLEKRLEEMQKKCDFYEIEKDKATKDAFDLQKEIKNLENSKEEMQKKCLDYEEYIFNLSKMLSYTRTRNDFEHSILRLTHEQEEIVSRIKFKKDYLINGGAGTGKSLVLLKAIEKLIKDCKETFFENPQITFVTFTSSLVKYESYIANLMQMGITEKNIKTADSFFNLILKKVFPNNIINYNLSDNYKKKITEIINSTYKDSDKNLVAENILNEAVLFIWQNIITEDEYLKEKIERSGMKTRLSIEQRKIYWDIIQQLEEKITLEKEWMPEFAKVKVARALKENPLKDEDKLSDFIFIDEAQDLSVCSLFCLKAVIRKFLVIAADKDQTIYQVQLPLIRSGIDVAGNSFTLHTNFRNTIQINEVAEKYRSLIPEMKNATNLSSFRMGPPVELVDLDSNDKTELYELIAKRVNIYLNDLNYTPENICIIVNENKNQKIEKIINALSHLGIETEKIKDKDYKQNGKVCISTVQSCKGLDFPVVILLADHRSHINENKYDEQTVEKLQRNMFYVAMTRAMDMLTIITLKDSSNDVINDIKKCCIS